MRATTWTLGIIAGIVLLFFVVAVAPRLHLSRTEYKYLSITSVITSYPDIQHMKETGWMVDDILVDSCGNMTLIFKKVP